MSSLQQFDSCEELSDEQLANICGGTISASGPLGTVNLGLGPNGLDVNTQGILGQRQASVGSGGVSTSGDSTVTSIASGLGINTLNSLNVGG